MKGPVSTTIDSMKGQQWIYNDVVVEILGCMVGTGETGQEIEIYLNSGNTIYTDYVNIEKVIKKFRPLHEQALILQRNEEKKLTVCAPSTTSEIRDLLMDQLHALRNNPSKEVIAQSRAINETVNQFTLLAKAELEYKKFVKTSHLPKDV